MRAATLLAKLGQGWSANCAVTSNPTERPVARSICRRGENCPSRRGVWARISRRRWARQSRPSSGRKPAAKGVQFWCLPKLCLARTESGSFWRTMNNFGAYCANLKQSDSYCLVATQSSAGWVKPNYLCAKRCSVSQNGAGRVTMHQPSEWSRLRALRASQTTERIPELPSGRSLDDYTRWA